MTGNTIAASIPIPAPTKNLMNGFPKDGAAKLKAPQTTA